MSDSLTTAIEDLASAIGELVSTGGFLPPFSIANSAAIEIETVQGTFGTSPPLPGAVRGVDNVHARFKTPTEAPNPDVADLVGSIMYARGTVQHGLLADSTRLNELSEAVNERLSIVVALVLGDAELRSRLRERWGLRPSDAPDDDTYFAELDDQGRWFVVLPFLVRRFQLALTDQGKPGSAEEWKNIGRSVADALDAWREVTSYHYRLVSFLNAPVLEDAEVSLGTHRIAGSDLNVALNSVTNAMIADAFTDIFRPAVLPFGLSNANTAVVIEFTLSAGSTAGSAEVLSDGALEASRRVVDVLRILRDDDIGIGHAYVKRLDENVPPLSPPSLLALQESGAVFTPRRGYFGPPKDKPIGTSDITRLIRLVARHLTGVDLRGLPIAIRRFRDMYERYWPTDHESLLDACIALEALFLNDQETKELRFRLSLRAARLLANTQDRRQSIADDIRKLYDVRSRIAHGETVESMKPAEATQLNRVLVRTRLMVRMALHAVLEGAGPEGIRNVEKLRQWWLRLELS